MPLFGKKKKQTNQQPCCACVTSYDSTKMAGSTKASSQRAVVLVIEKYHYREKSHVFHE